MLSNIGHKLFSLYSVLFRTTLHGNNMVPGDVFPFYSCDFLFVSLELSHEEAFDSAHSMWQLPLSEGEARKPQGANIDDDDLAKALAAASASQKKENVTRDPSIGKPGDPNLRTSKAYSAKDVWAWFEKTRNKKNRKQQPLVKDAQLEMLRIICQRVCDELEDIANDAPMREPLMWFLHGPPGTGKSEVLKLAKELFVDVCGWQMGLEYQMAALQAVTAQLLNGDTLHHACGINPFGNKSDPKSAQKASQRQAEVAQRVLQWRWLAKLCFAP